MVLCDATLFKPGSSSDLELQNVPWYFFPSTSLEEATTTAASGSRSPSSSKRLHFLADLMKREAQIRGEKCCSPLPISPAKKETGTYQFIDQEEL
jgi:hypothetical protein